MERTLAAVEAGTSSTARARALESSSRKSASVEMTWLAMLRARGLPSFSRTREKTGTSADESAPSPKRRRKALGTVHARVSASETAPAPSSAAVAWSRTSPRTRESIVSTVTVRAECRKRASAAGGAAAVRGSAVTRATRTGSRRRGPASRKDRSGRGRQALEGRQDLVDEHVFQHRVVLEARGRVVEAVAGVVEGALAASAPKAATRGLIRQLEGQLQIRAQGAGGQAEEPQQRAGHAQAVRDDSALGERGLDRDVQ